MNHIVAETCAYTFDDAGNVDIRGPNVLLGVFYTENRNWNTIQFISL